MNSIIVKLGKIIPQISDICFYSRDQINRRALSSIDEVIKGSISVTKSLEYMGIRKMTPRESYESMATGSSSRRTTNSKSLNDTNTMEVDITKSTFYKTVITFKDLNSGELINLKLAIPYLDRYGILLCNDIPYNIKPIFTDNVLSPHSSGIFMKLYILKTNISSVPIIVNINGVKENVSVIHTDMNRKVTGDSSTNLNRAITPIAFYVLSTYGIIESMKKVTNAECVIVDKLKYHHDEQDGLYYTHADSRLGILIKIKERLDVIDNLIASIFYILIYGTTKNEEELMQYLFEKNVSDELTFWTIRFGRFFYKGSLTVVKSTTEIYDHLEKVKNFLDSISRHDLSTIGINVNNFTDLMLSIMGKYNSIILRYKEINSNIEQHKKLNVLYYVLNNVIIGVNSGFLEISKREKNRQFNLSTKELEKILSDNITERLTYKMVKSTKKNLSIALSSGCTDNLLDTLLVSDDQNRGDGVFVSKNNTFPASLRNITPIHHIVGSMHGLTKKAPTPLLRLNPFIRVDVNNQFLIRPEILDLCKEVYGRMRSITEYTNHQITDEIDDLDDIDIDS